jgi:tRNA(adenine34) deaminase
VEVPTDERAFDTLMTAALDEARLALEHGDVPVGAVIARLDGPVDDPGVIVARAHNRREVDGDPTAHAEVLALRAAASTTGSWRLSDHVLVVTLEPCVMCAGAAAAARIGAVVFGAADGKAGGCGSLYNVLADPRLNHECPVLPGLRATEATGLLERFFEARRKTTTL